MIVGRMIFSIVGGLSCVGGQNRVFGLRLLTWLGLRLLHRRRM